MQQLPSYHSLQLTNLHLTKFSLKHAFVDFENSRPHRQSKNMQLLCDNFASFDKFLPRDALVHSAVLRLHVVRLSVCPSVCPSVCL